VRGSLRFCVAKLRGNAARMRAVFLSFNAVLLSSAEAGELPLVAVDRVGSRKGRGESHAANLALAHRCCVDAGQVRTAKPQCSALARWRHSTGGATLQVGRQRLVALLREASSRCCCARKKKTGTTASRSACPVPECGRVGPSAEGRASSTRLCSALGGQHGSVLAPCCASAAVAGVR
jgi:hypothetical protein